MSWWLRLRPIGRSSGGRTAAMLLTARHLYPHVHSNLHVRTHKRTHSRPTTCTDIGTALLTCTQAFYEPRRPPHRIAAAPPTPRRSSRISPSGGVLPSESPRLPTHASPTRPPPPSPAVRAGGATTRRAWQAQLAEAPPPSTPSRARTSSSSSSRPPAPAPAPPPQQPLSTAAHSYAACCTFFGTAMDGCVKEGRHLTEHQGQMLTREVREAAGE